MSPPGGDPYWVRVAILVLVYVSLWTVIGRYWGLQHDAQIYVAQALAQINPQVYGQDLFLRFQSQADFTFFPYVCAVAINWLGIDRAGAVLTFLGFIAWMLIAGWLARRLSGTELGWLSFGLLLVIPGWYGPGHVFRTAEPFLSARPFAEALSLGAFVAITCDRRILAAVLIGVAALAHPIMAFPAALVLVGMYATRRAPRRFWPVAAVGLCLTAIAGGILLGGRTPLMSGEWLRLTQIRSDFLFLQYWQPEDWQANLLPLLTLLLATQVVCGWAQRLALACFWVGAAGLALAAFASSVLPVKLLLQGQPWRWVWPAIVVATVLLPASVLGLWERALAGRTVAVLVASAWLLSYWSSAGDLPPAGASTLLLLCAGAVWAGRERTPATAARLLMIGAAATLAVTLTGLAMSAYAITTGRFDFGTDPLWVQTSANVLSLVAAAGCVVVAAWWLLFRSWSRISGTLLAIAAMALAIAASPGTARAWSATEFASAARERFAPWRQRVPADAEVFWPDGLREVWFLLDRRSYLSVSQLGGIVFSEDTAREAQRRARALTPLVEERYWYRESASTKLERLTLPTLSAICGNTDLGFVVHRQDLGLHVPRVEWPTRAKFVYLYDCSQIRGQAESARPHTEPAS